MATILIIEDDAGMSKSIKRMLIIEGHAVLEAANGVVALKVLESEPVDLVITDIFMPYKDGISTIMDIQENNPDIRIIAISGGGRKDTIDYLELAGNLGASRIFQKPFDQNELLDAVRELLQS